MTSHDYVRDSAVPDVRDTPDAPFTSSWGAYPSIFNLGHRAVAELLQHPVYVEEKIDGCVDVNTRILTADLRYVRADSLHIGDELLGFDSSTNDPRLRRSVVTHAAPFTAMLQRVIFSDGRVVSATENHPWLVRQKSNNNGKTWVETRHLRPGMSVVALPVWDSEHRTEAKGYLAGIYDGEGSLVRHGSGRVLSVYQRLGAVDDRIQELLAAGGYRVRRDVRRRRADYSEVASTILTGGWPETLRLLGDVRPMRLLPRADEFWDGAPLNGIADVFVVSVDAALPGRAMGLSTTSQTYCAEGLFSHNSQFSFGVHADKDGAIDLRVRSKGAAIIADAPPALFRGACATVTRLYNAGLLSFGYTYRGEVLQGPRHNTLAYDRVPAGHIILFDIQDETGAFLGPEDKAAEATRLGLEAVPLLYAGVVSSANDVRRFLDLTSVLGGQKIEGVVLKPQGYNLYGVDKKVLMGKFVSEAFKELHVGAWKDANPSRHDIVERIIEGLRTPARWEKAVIHLREQDKLQDSPRDIGAVLAEVQRDLDKEVQDEVKEALFAHFWKDIRRRATGGLPEWYKQRLLEAAFETVPDTGLPGALATPHSDGGDA